MPQTDSSVCSAPGSVIRFRQLTALPPGNASTNRGAANLEVHATSQLGALTLPPKSSATIGKNLTMQVLTVAAPIGPKAHGHSLTVAALSVALGNIALENVVSKNVAAGTDGLAFYGYHPLAILAFALVVGRELEPNPHLLAELQELGLSLGVVGEQTAAKK